MTWEIHPPPVDRSGFIGVLAPATEGGDLAAQRGRPTARRMSRSSPGRQDDTETRIAFTCSIL